MIDTSNLTLVQALTLNAIVWNCVKSNILIPINTADVSDYLRKLHPCFFWERHRLCDDLSEALLNYDKRKSLNNFLNINTVYRKLMWPKVKLKGVTKSQALAEAREVIEWVRRRYEEAI